MGIFWMCVCVCALAYVDCPAAASDALQTIAALPQIQIDTAIYSSEHVAGQTGESEREADSEPIQCARRCSTVCNCVYSTYAPVNFCLYLINVLISISKTDSSHD